MSVPFSFVKEIAMIPSVHSEDKVRLPGALTSHSRHLSLLWQNHIHCVPFSLWHYLYCQP